MNTKDQEKAIHKLGREIGEILGEFWGSITLNFSGGRYVNSNIVQSIKPEPEKQEKKP
jgi:hypothetical protein